jgi:sugar lactone lactonase YvrE
VADTARGAIWRVWLDHRGRVLSPMGCDTTFTPNTLCLDDLYVAHPYLEGADGIVIDDDDTIFAAPNERNAIVAVTRKGGVVEVFRNPVAATRLRNEGPLEFPTSPVLTGRSLCVTSSDGGRRDNFPATPGEGAKVSCARM